VNPPEPETLAELIADCAEIPRTLRTCVQRLPEPRAPRPWQVDEVCLDQVKGLDEYV